MIDFRLKHSTGYMLFSYLKKWRILLFMLLFDILFVISLYAAATLFDTFFSIYEASMVGSWQGYISLLLYFFVVVFSYSFFKYCILDFLDVISGGTKKKFTFERFKEFYLYNLIMLFLLLCIFLGITFFFSVALIDLLKTAGVQVFVILFLFFSYVFVQMSHAVFMHNKTHLQNIHKDVIKQFSWKFFFRYIFWNVIFAIIFFTVYIILFLLVGKLSGKALVGQGWYTAFYVLNIFIFVFLVLFLYFFVIWNRLYLYVAVKRELSKHSTSKK